VTFPIVARWRDLVRGCSLLSGRFIYTVIGQSINQQIRNGTRCEREKQSYTRPSPFRFASPPRAAARSAPLCGSFTQRK
jgi:hypothetical protein